MSAPLLQIAPKAGRPVPADRLAGLDEIVAAARTGEVTSFLVVAAGPDFNRWREGHVVGRHDRLNLMAQLMMCLRQLEDIEQQDGG